MEDYSLECLHQFGKDEKLVEYGPDYYVIYKDGKMYVNGKYFYDIEIPQPYGTYYADFDKTNSIDAMDVNLPSQLNCSLLRYIFHYCKDTNILYYLLLDNKDNHESFYFIQDRMNDEYYRLKDPHL